MAHIHGEATLKHPIYSYSTGDEYGMVGVSIYDTLTITLDRVYPVLPNDGAVGFLVPVDSKNAGEEFVWLEFVGEPEVSKTEKVRRFEGALTKQSRRAIEKVVPDSVIVIGSLNKTASVRGSLPNTFDYASYLVTCTLELTGVFARLPLDPS